MGKTTRLSVPLATAFSISTIALGGALWYIDGEQKKALATLNQNALELFAEIDNLKKELVETQEELTRAQEINEELEKRLIEEKERNDSFENQIRAITGTVGSLDKLSKTDKELLQKYSKVFFLNEHYMPERLVQIDKQYLYTEDDPTFVHADVEPFLEDMLKDAARNDIKLWVISAFRSYDEQAQLKGNYTVTYGSGANTFSADQGYSEHQLGTTIDFTTEDLNGGLQGFQGTPAYEWLVKNAYKYGFTLSYPENNSYYVFEPWHWRFVGTDLARYLYRNNMHFYDLEQRKIDEYLISIFD